MKQIKITMWALILLLASLNPIYANKSGQVLATSLEKDFSTDEIILQFHSEAQAESEEEFIEELGADSHLWKRELFNFGLHKKKKKKHYRKLHRLRKIKSELAVLNIERKLSKKQIKKLIKKLNSKKYRKLGYEVEAVYPNYLYEISSEPSDVEILAQPNDPLYDQQWPHQQIKPEKLWKLTKGEGTVVAVIDTGVDHKHQDLAENIWNNEDEIPNNGKDDDNNGYIDDTRGWDFVNSAGLNCISGEDCSNEDNNPSDHNGHGTHVAGIVAAVQNNKLGISGIAPKAKIMPLRAGYSTGFSAFLKTSDIMEAITYAINNDADVINMSFAGPELSVLADILRLAHSLGIVSVAAAGNASSSTRTYPAALSTVIAVGAIADNNFKAHYSNFGDWVDLAAPGTWVLSTIPNNQYDIKTGTSMSAPHVAGVAALIKSKNKLDRPSADEVKARILSSTLETTFPAFPGSSETLGGVSADISFPLEIDNVELPERSLVGEKVTISAEASDSESVIVNYEWKSDKDGMLASTESFDTDSLSLGSHAITVRAQNSQGEWSEPAFKIINIVESRQVNPQNFAEKFRHKMRKRRRRLVARLPKNQRINVKAYKWISSVDGTVSERKSVRLNDLSRGFHKMSLLIQDRAGNWSKPLQKVLKI